MPPLDLPADYPRIQRVESFFELATTPFAHGVNALWWPRTLPGDFGEVVERLGGGRGIVTLDDARLRRLRLSAAGRAAVEILLADQRWLRERGLSPVLECVHDYRRDEASAIVPTDVYSFHVDSAPAPTDTWLCTYRGPATEGLRHDQAQPRVEVPATRAALLKQFGGDEGDDFGEFLSENCYDLHYVPLPQARPFSFGVGNLWRIAVQYPGSPVPACIHRAPENSPGQSPRLLLIS